MVSRDTRTAVHRLIRLTMIRSSVLSPGCGQDSTGPSQSVQLESLVYEHDVAVDPATAGRRPVSVSLHSPPSRIDPQGRSHQISCNLVQIGPRRFECSRVLWWCQVGTECGTVAVHGLEVFRATGI